MCLPFMDKLCRGGHRRRNNITASPRPSLAPTPQQSSATIQTGNTPNTTTTTSTNAVNTLENSASTNRLDVSTVSQVQGSGAAIAGPAKPSSWWDYFGMSKSKKGSIESL